MATNLNFVESSFRLGSGRYIQADGAVLRLGEELERLGCKKPLIIGSKTAWSKAREKVSHALAEKEIPICYYQYNGFCNPDHCEEIAKHFLPEGCDVIVGVGGGNIMDAAKLLAARQGLYVINIPTSSATCAAYTPVSIMYNEKGQTIGSCHHLTEVNAILVDMEILCEQPLRLLISGVYDSLAKLIETNQRLQGKEEKELDIGLQASYVLSDFIYVKILKLLPQVSDDIRNGRNTKAVYDMVFLTIPVTGIISSLARGCNQCAIAHRIYETTRILFPKESYDYLHGEIVGLGILPQLIYNGEPEEKNRFAAKMANLGMPITLGQIGVPTTEETLQAYCNEIINSPAMEGTTKEEQLKLKEAMRCILK